MTFLEFLTLESILGPDLYAVLVGLIGLLLTRVIDRFFPPLHQKEVPPDKIRAPVIPPSKEDKEVSSEAEETTEDNDSE